MPGCHSPGRVRPERQTLTVNGNTRTYIVRGPLGAMKSGQPMPLVLVLHGGGGDADNAEKMTSFTEKAEKEGFIVVYPEGSSRFRDKLKTWNAGHCCGYVMKHRVDDVAFIDALIDRLIKDYPVDPARIYATGIALNVDIYQASDADKRIPLGKASLKALGILPDKDVPGR